MRYRWKTAARVAFLVLPALACTPSPLLSQPSWIHPRRAVVAWDAAATGEDSLDQLSLEAVFVSMGFRTERIHPAQCEGAMRDSNTICIIPHAAAVRRTRNASRSLLAALEGGGVLVTDGVSPLSQMLGVPEKEVVAHLDHISRSVRSKDRKFAVTPARCLGCGYVFESRGRFSSPGRCPRCRGEHIEDPRYRIV